MPGNVKGGLKAAITNKARYGEDFYKVQGAAGGRASHTGGFAANSVCDGSCGLSHLFEGEHKKSQCAGKRGGAKSRRNKKVA